MSIEKKIENFFPNSSCQSELFLGEACNANQIDQPIMVNGAWSTRRLNKYDWLAIN